MEPSKSRINFIGDLRNLLKKTRNSDASYKLKKVDPLIREAYQRSKEEVANLLKVRADHYLKNPSTNESLFSALCYMWRDLDETRHLILCEYIGILGNKQNDSLVEPVMADMQNDSAVEPGLKEYECESKSPEEEVNESPTYGSTTPLEHTPQEPSHLNSALTASNTKDVKNQLRLNPRLKEKQGNPIHTGIYRLKLVTLILCRALCHKFTFSLRVSIDMGAFRDIIYEYESNGGMQYRFFQVKHKVGNIRKITASNLLTEKTISFSLILYFIAYRFWKGRFNTKNKIKDVIVLTNTNFDFNDLKQAGIEIEIVHGTDCDLDTLATGTAMCYRFRENVCEILEPKINLFNSKRLAKQLALSYLKGSYMYRSDNIFNEYHIALAREVIDVEAKKFRQSFIDGIGLSPEAAEFRESFGQELLKQSEGRIILENINQNEDECKLKLGNRFGKPQIDQDNYGLLPRYVGKEEIRDFLRKLIFQVNQPNVDEIDDTIKDEIQRAFDLDPYTADIMYNKLFMKILTCMQNTSGGVRSFSSEDFLGSFDTKAKVQFSNSACSNDEETKPQDENKHKEKQSNDPFHGVIFQTKSMMFVICRALLDNNSFRVSAEHPEAGKCDDIVFERTGNNAEKEYTYFQAKHKKDISNKIYAEDLLTKGDCDYSLVKYFFTFQSLKTNKLFNGSIKDLIILTNIGFNENDLKKRNIEIRSIDLDDEIFGNIHGSASKLLAYKFSKNTAKLLVENVQAYEDSKVIEIAKSLVKNFLESRLLKEGICKTYDRVLAEDIIDIESKKFKQEFIEGENLSKNVEKFRSAFEAELGKKSMNKINLQNINSSKVLGKQKIGLNLPESFGNNNPERIDWPGTVYTTTHLEEFLDHIVYVISEVPESVIKKDIELYSKFERGVCDYAFNGLFKHLFCWIPYKTWPDLQPNEADRNWLSRSQVEVFFERHKNPKYSYENLQKVLHVVKKIDFVSCDVEISETRKLEFQRKQLGIHI